MGGKQYRAQVIESLTPANAAGTVLTPAKCVMMRDNSSARKWILVLALISIVGAGLCCVSEDMLLAGASYADDPAVPVPAGSLALVTPADPLSEPVQMVKMDTLMMATAPPCHLSGEIETADVQFPSSTLKVPRRC